VFFFLTRKKISHFFLSEQKISPKLFSLWYNEGIYGLVGQRVWRISLEWTKMKNIWKMKVKKGSLQSFLQNLWIQYTMPRLISVHIYQSINRKNQTMKDTYQTHTLPINHMFYYCGNITNFLSECYTFGADMSRLISNACGTFTKKFRLVSQINSTPTSTFHIKLKLLHLSFLKYHAHNNSSH